MTPRELRAHLTPLPEFLPRTKAMEDTIKVGSGYDGAWYRSQKEHWLGWLAEYYGAGANGRSAQTPRNARYAYNHIQCAPMLFWLSEALGVEPAKLDAAFDVVAGINNKGAPQCAALRTQLPWETVAYRLMHFPYRKIDRFWIWTVKSRK